jgi:hypothetical protein
VLGLLSLVNYARSMPKLPNSPLLDAFYSLRKVRFVDYVVAIKDAPRLVTRDSHNDYFGHSRRTMLRTAERRRSWKSNPGSLAAVVSFDQAARKSFMG